MLPQVILSHLGSIGEVASTWLSENGYLSTQCPPLPKGNINYDIYMGYPEMFAWDKKRCVAYVRYVILGYENIPPLISSS